MEKNHGGEDNRRRYARVPGPFTAWRVGEERREVRIVNLGLGGCFIKEVASKNDPETFKLRIDLGGAGEIEVSAAALYHRADGTAVTFLNLTQHAFDGIRGTVDRIMA